MIFVLATALSWYLWGLVAPGAPSDTLAIDNGGPHESAGGKPTEGASATSGTTDKTSSASHQPYQLSVVAGGDVLIHRKVWQSAEQTDGSYDFSRHLQGIAPFVSAADLALCGFEGPVRPEGEELSNFPKFGVPKEIVQNLKDIGFDGCSTANNHSLDRGFASIEATLEAFKEARLGFSGTALTAHEAAEIPMYVIHKGDEEVRIAHISYTALSNFLRTKPDQQWAYNSLQPYGPMEIEHIIADGYRARELGADIVLLSMHWGREYTRAPSEKARRIGEELAASGVFDVILGSHPHTPQPIEFIPGADGVGGTWVVWSMGNMLTGMSPAAQGYRATTGYFATITIDVSADRTFASKVEWTAVTTDAPHDYRAFLVHDLQRANPTELTHQQIAKRADVTHEVMDSSSQERTDLPVAGGDSLSIERVSR